MGTRFDVVFVLLVAGCNFEPGTLEDPGTGEGAVGGSEQPDAGVSATACPASYTITFPASTSRYRLVKEAATWFEAATACALDGPAHHAPHLIVLSDEAERAGMLGTIGEDVWVGLSNRATGDCSFQWVTSERAAPAPGAAPWEPDDPDRDGISCADLEADGGLMGDSDCDDELAYVCECDRFGNDPSRY